MAKRKIVRIDEERCSGCGLCIPNCAEGALQVIDGKARLISEKFCDGLGACLGHCPEDAISVTEREADEFDDKAVELHLKSKPETRPAVEPPPLHSEGCPSSRPMQFNNSGSQTKAKAAVSISRLSHWPVQLKLVPVNAPYFEEADLLVTADCVPFAYPNFHEEFMANKTVVVGCPKLDDIQYYREKLTEIFKSNTIRTVTVVFMEVPCCSGLVRATEEAIAATDKTIPLKKVRIGIRGEVEHEEQTHPQTRTFIHSH